MTILSRPLYTNRILHLSLAAFTRMERVDSITAFFGSACFINPCGKSYLDLSVSDY